MPLYSLKSVSWFFVFLFWACFSCLGQVSSENNEYWIHWVIWISWLKGDKIYQYLYAIWHYSNGSFSNVVSHDRLRKKHLYGAHFRPLTLNSWSDSKSYVVTEDGVTDQFEERKKSSSLKVKTPYCALLLTGRKSSVNSPSAVNQGKSFWWK